MLQDLYKYITTLKRFNSLFVAAVGKLKGPVLGLIVIALTLSACALFEEREEKADRISTNQNFSKGQALVLAREFDKALPFLAMTLKEGQSPNNRNYEMTLLYSARAYDQLGQPEKAILAINEFLTKPYSTTEEIQTRALLLKNYAKQGLDIANNIEKSRLEQAVKMNEGESADILRGLYWSMEFSCDQFCLAELKFLKEIQLQFLYLIEKDVAIAGESREILQQRYHYFHQFLKKDYLQLSFRREIAAGILDSLQRLSSLYLALPNQGGIRTAELIHSLQALGKDTESWLYQ